MLIQRRCGCHVDLETRIIHVFNVFCAAHADKFDRAAYVRGLGRVNASEHDPDAGEPGEAGRADAGAPTTVTAGDAGSATRAAAAGSARR